MEADERALRAADRLLARRDHAANELTRKLSRGLGSEAAASLVAQLAEHGLVDDARFAATLAERHLERGLGPLRIAADLARAGVDRACAEGVLDVLDADRVEAAARRALGARTGLAGARRLASRGFGDDLVERLASPGG